MTPRPARTLSESGASSPGPTRQGSGGRPRARVRRADGTSPRPVSTLEPRRRPRQERAQATVAAIIEAAAGLIADEGYATLTTNKVATRAGVSIGSLYQYFPNKQALLVALLEKHMSGLRPVIERSLEEMAHPGVPFPMALRRLFVGLLDLHRDADPRLQRALDEEVPHPPHIREEQRRREAEYTARVAAILRDRPDVQVEDPEMAALVQVQATSALARWLAHDAPPGFDKEACVEEAVRLLAAHLKPPRSA